MPRKPPQSIPMLWTHSIKMGIYLRTLQSFQVPASILRDDDLRRSESAKIVRG